MSDDSEEISVSFYFNGRDVKEIAKYGDDGKKIWSIHTVDHKVIKPHYHKWKDGVQLIDFMNEIEEVEES